MTASLEVVRPGPQSLLQDLGRVGHAAVGVGRSGAADQSSFRWANRIVGNPDGAAVIECVLGGLAVRFDDDVLIAVTGAPAPLTIDGASAAHATPIRVRSGQAVKLGVPKVGLRSYLAVRGGIDVPLVLGSRSTDTLSGIGPGPLLRGARLAVGPVADQHIGGQHITDPPVPDRPVTDQHSTVGQSPPAGAGTLILRTTLGPRDDWFDAPTDLAVGEWVVSPNSNRVGIRLDRPVDAADEHRPALRRKHSRELPSEGVALGSVQVPPSGQPVLFLADHPVTGGYPVIGVVLSHDVDIAAQARPGQRLRFILAPPPINSSGVLSSASTTSHHPEEH